MLHHGWDIHLVWVMSLMIYDTKESWVLFLDVKTLQGLKMLNVSMVAVGAMVQWFRGGHSNPS